MVPAASSRLRLAAESLVSGTNTLWSLVRLAWDFRFAELLKVLGVFVHGTELKVRILVDA